MANVVAKKKFGQNFIHDKKLITKIVDLLGTDPNSFVIEIGPGTGALTAQLVARFKKVVAIEIDRDLKEVLQTNVVGDNFELLMEDALKVDYEQLIADNPANNVYLISNLPYYITSELLFKTFTLSSLLTKAVFMMQKEVAVRVCANVNDASYNNLSIAAQFYAKRKYEFTVYKGMFYPVPKVDSAIVSLIFDDKYEKDLADPEAFLGFVRELFNNKRKTILNNLGRVLADKMKAKTILEACKIDQNLRPENLSLKAYLTIYQKLH